MDCPPSARPPTVQTVVVFPRNSVQAVKQAGRVEYFPKRSVRCLKQSRTKAEPKTERRVFTEEFKRDAVRLARERGNVSQVARDLGIHESVLTRWRRRLEDAPERPFPGQGNPQDPELARLRRENARLKEENEILKKAVGIFTVRPQ